jgi:peroxiredoxin
MKTAITILAGLVLGILVAVGILAAFVFVGPDPVGLRPTPPPTLVPATPTPVPATPSPSVASAAPSGGASGVPSGSAGPGAAFRIGSPAPALVVPQLGGGTIDLANLRGKAVWLTFLQTTCPACEDAVPSMSGFGTRYADDGLVVTAIDVREDEKLVLAFTERLKASFPVGLDTDGKAAAAWGATDLPVHVWIDKDGVVRDAIVGDASADRMAAGVRTILPGATITP